MVNGVEKSCLFTIQPDTRPDKHPFAVMFPTNAIIALPFLLKFVLHQLQRGISGCLAAQCPMFTYSRLFHVFDFWYGKGSMQWVYWRVFVLVKHLPAAAGNQNNGLQDAKKLKRAAPHRL